MFENNVRETGRALLVAKQQFVSQYGPNYLIATMTLFGDPAMRLPQGPNEQRTYLPLVLDAN